MVWGVIQNVRFALKYRGGWRGLLEHMYTVGVNSGISSERFFVFYCAVGWDGGGGKRG
jgi:hypothetical protein